MNLHSGARSCPASRALLIERIERGRWPVSAAAQAAGVSRRTAYKWISRHAIEGAAGLADRSSRPRSSPSALTLEEVFCVQLLRQSRMTGAQIASSLELPHSTVARVLKRQGLNRLQSLEPKEPVRRYTRRHPGELIHLDVKKLGRISGFYGHRITGDRRRRRRGAGWDFVHVAIDDASRLAYAEVLRDERGDTSAAFLARALAWFKRLGIRVREVMTDNGSGYVSDLFRAACAHFKLQHLRTRPYRPCTNGKAERFIQTLLREWAYARPYRTSGIRTRVLSLFLLYYNRERPHGSLGGQPPCSRLTPGCEQRL
jgi:transposase InsO family protein